MNVRIVFRTADESGDNPLVRGDILEVREIPAGAQVVADIVGDGLGMIALLNVPVTSEQVIAGESRLTSPLYTFDEVTGEPTELNRRQYSIAWDAMDNAGRNALLRTVGASRQGLIRGWSAMRDTQLLDRETGLPVLLASVLLP